MPSDDELGLQRDRSEIETHATRDLAELGDPAGDLEARVIDRE